MAGTVTVPDEASRAVVRSATGMGLAAAVSRVVGGGRVVVIAAVLGTTYLGNAFQSSNTVSNLLFELLAAGALSAVLVPTFVELLDGGDRSGAERLAGELLGVTLLALGALSVIGMAAAPWIAALLTSSVQDPVVAEQQTALTTQLLWWFIPQVVLYGVGAIATAVLHAQRRFVVPAIAPIGNTVVMVGFLAAFAVVAGPDPGLELSGLEVTLLGLGGTLGVVAFVAAPTIAVWRGGFRLVPRFRRRHDGLVPLLRLSGWASVQHGFAALLYGAAIIAGGGVEGGVVAYQVGWFLFLAPYGIIAQPIHTTILPEMVDEHGAGRTDAFAASIRWAADSMSLLLVPLTALCLALSIPAMSVVAFGAASGSDSVELLAAALAALGLGLLPYGLFFLLARAFYVLGDSRTPALWGAAGSLVGAVGMLVVGSVTSGTATVAGLGVAHSVAYLLASAALVIVLRRRSGRWVLPSALPGSVLVAAVAGTAVWWVERAWSPSGRAAEFLAVTSLSVAALGIYVVGMRILGVSVTQRLPGPGRRAAEGAST